MHVEALMENENSDDEKSIDGYNTVRADRNRHGDSVLIFISKIFIHSHFRGDKLELLTVLVSS